MLRPKGSPRAFACRTPVHALLLGACPKPNPAGDSTACARWRANRALPDLPTPAACSPFGFRAAASERRIGNGYSRPQPCFCSTSRSH